MVYNGFVIVDTHGIGDRNFQWKEENGFRTYHEESGDYTTPAGPGGGGSTPPTLPMYGPYMQGQGPGSTPAPSGGGGGDEGGGGGGGGWQQWLNPQTVGATVGLIGGVAGAIGQNRSPDKARIKAVCGRKPLFNIGGKKDTYNQCVQNLMMPQQPIYPVQQGMSTGTKVFIGIMAFLLILGIIIAIVMMSRKQTTATA